MTDNVILLIALFATAVVAAIVREFWPGRRERRERRRAVRGEWVDPNLQPRLNVWGHGYHYDLGAVPRRFGRRRRRR